MVLNVDGNGDLMVLIEGNAYYLNQAAVACVTDPVVLPSRRDWHANAFPIGTIFKFNIITISTSRLLSLLFSVFSHMKLGEEEKAVTKDLD